MAILHKTSVRGSLYHIQLNASDLGFYRDLFAFLNYRTIDESAEHVGVTDGRIDIWVMKTAPAYRQVKYHRKASGLNHLAFRVGRREDVDIFCRDFLALRGRPPLYNGPKEHPEYQPGYYAVYFEDADRIKLEVVYVPEP